MGGLLTGNAAHGGLSASAGTPYGQTAQAGLGGNTGRKYFFIQIKLNDKNRILFELFFFSIQTKRRKTLIEKEKLLEIKMI